MAGVVSFGRTAGASLRPSPGKPKPIGATNVLFGGTGLDVPVYSRETLGGIVEGPAIVVEASTTILIPKLWSIEPTQGNHLVMERNSK